MDKTGEGMVLYVRSQLASTDGRLMRYIAFMHSHSLAYRVFCWNRTETSASKAAEDFHIDQYLMPAKTGGRYLNVFKLIRWNFAIFFYCLRNRAQIKKIHCVDLDSILPCFLFRKLFSRPLIFDSYDRYSDSRRMRGPLKYWVDKVESYLLQKADVAILPSHCRTEQYQLACTDNLIIIENVPLFSVSKPLSVAGSNISLSTVLQQISLKRSEFRVLLSYVGVLEPESRGLENLLNCVTQMPDIGLIVAGSGPLHSTIAEAAALHPNIFFVGAIEYTVAEQIMAIADMHVGLYYLSNPNHKYAAPNKYYEHLYFAKPLLTSKGTPPGALVELCSTGFAVGDTKEDLCSFLAGITPAALNLACTNAGQLWQQRYKNYHSDTFAAVYGKVVKN